MEKSTVMALWGITLTRREPKNCQRCGDSVPSLSSCRGDIARFGEDSKAFIQLFAFDLNRTRKLHENG